MKFFRDLVLPGFFLVCVALILALEAGLRLAHDRYDASLFQPEPERGFSLRPHAEGWNETEKGRPTSGLTAMGCGTGSGRYSARRIRYA